MTRNEQLERYRAVSERLLNALTAQTSAHTAYAQARDLHDDRRMAYILDGIPGLPGPRCAAEVREAAMARALEQETRAVREARDLLRRADAELEAARVQERAERESLRSVQFALAQ